MTTVTQNLQREVVIVSSSILRESRTAYEDSPIAFYSVKDIQHVLKVSRSSVYELVSRDDFPKIRIGSTIRIPVAQFRAWLATQTASSEKP